MNIAKNMEFVFVAVIAAVTFTGVASAALPKIAHHAAAPQVLAQADTKMQVVTIVGHRMTAAEKARSAN
jgi:hypothetical protein